ncbi:TNT domain-containing protein, partial [Caldanaerobacter sp.]
TKPYNVYEVIKPFEALEGKTASWFNQPGGGIQYKMPKTIEELINKGYIR